TPSVPARSRGGADWRRRAACRLMPAEMFFPVGTSGMAIEEVASAKQVCGGCEVSGPCLEFALETRQEFGVWGGRDEDERREMVRRAKANPVLR
ncbi:MAG TPA: WhiB family transcriptional regulator, partial [Acidimicrobiales bacterium]|nr:WhiB family transcriptional regulator [Acidimicrobiales bacterium]